MKSFQQLAQGAYEAHGKELHKLIGVSVPAWEKLAPTEQACWVKAMQQVVAEVAAIR